jgi:hypothetical protein
MGCFINYFVTSWRDSFRGGSEVNVNAYSDFSMKTKLANTDQIPASIQSVIVPHVQWNTDRHITLCPHVERKR